MFIIQFYYQTNIKIPLFANTFSFKSKNHIKFKLTSIIWHSKNHNITNILVKLKNNRASGILSKMLYDHTPKSVCKNENDKT